MIAFRDRFDAGRRLAARLQHLAQERPLVLALPRGGVAVAYEIARSLRAPLDVLVVRKLGAPMHPEFGFGAIVENEVEPYLDPATVRVLGLSDEEIAEIVRSKRGEIEERVHRYRGGRPLPDISDRTVILVDDGVATGGTARAAIYALSKRMPGRLIVAVPVAAQEMAERLRHEVDAFICLECPAELWAIGLWYADFSQQSDESVLLLLEQARAEMAVAATPIE